MSDMKRRGMTHFLFVPCCFILSASNAGCTGVLSEASAARTPERRSTDGLVLGEGIKPSSQQAADLIERAIERYQQTVRGYRCTLTRQERVKGRLTPVQTIDVCFRESPRSVRLAWKRKAGKVDRVVFVEGRDHNRKGEPCALVRPTNGLIRLVASRVSVPVHGKKAREASRHTVDEVGFGALLERIRDLNGRAGQRGHLDMRMLRDGVINGRATKVIQRRLPRGKGYPDALLIMHFDQESLLPVHFETYAYPNGQRLLGRYTFSDVQINPPMCAADFEL